MGMARLRAPAAVAVLAALALPAPAAALTPQDLERDGVRDIIVIREPGLSAGERADVRSDAGVQHVRMMRLADTEVVRAPAGRLTEALDALNADPDVRVAEPDAPVRALTNDPGWGDLWGLENTGQTLFGVVGNPDADIDAPAAWTVSSGAGVTVAVVDSGAQLDHQDLSAQIGGNPGERGGGKESNGVDDDLNGRVDDWRGWDFVDGDNLPQDGDGHGTHVAGTIAARANNMVGVAGVAPDAKVMPVRALDDNGDGYSSDIADAFAYAGALGARIVNASLGGNTPSTPIANAIAAYPNTLFVVAAGNDGTDNDGASPSYPCRYTHANILCVGATDSTDLRATFSNWGATSVDLFAPGDTILSTYTLGRYAYLDGTSMAAPHAAGAAALLASANPGWSVAQIKSALMSSVDAKSQLAPRSVAGGRLNAARALGLAGDGGSGGGEGPAGWTPPSQTPTSSPGTPLMNPPPTPPAPPPSVDDGDDRGSEPPPLKLRRRGVATICLRGCAARTFELRFTLTAPASVRTSYEVRACTRRGCAWKTVARRTVRGKSGANTLKVGAKVGSKRLKRGRYRVTVAVDTALGRSTGRATFTVR